MTLQEQYDRLTAPPIQKWLLANEHVEVQSLLLNPPEHVAEIKGEVVDQLVARKKARKKLPSWYSQSRILWPPPLSIEQASSETTAEYKASLIEGIQLTDLTGGTGIDLLAFSNRFQEVSYIEQNEWLCKVFSHNANTLGKRNITIKNTPAENALENIQQGQWVYLDPARRNQEKKKVFLLEDCSPNLLEVLPTLRDKGAIVMIKLSPILDLQHIISELHPYRLIVVSVQNEVKELLALIDENRKEEVQIEAVDLRQNNHSTFHFTLNSERESKVNYTPADSFLYEPNAAVMKAGAFKSVATSYNLHKLHPNTHLYTSSELETSFPGRVFNVIQEISGTELKSNFRGNNLHVIARNYPQNPSQITKKYRLKESGNQYLIAFTDYKEKKRMLLTELVKSAQTGD